MKKKLKYIIPIVIIILLVYVLLTPLGALRFAVLREGYPAKAVTLKVDKDSRREPVDMVGDQIVYTIFDPPIDKRTQTPLDSWVISKHGLIYWAEYYVV